MAVSKGMHVYSSQVKERLLKNSDDILRRASVKRMEPVIESKVIYLSINHSVITPLVNKKKRKVTHSSLKRSCAFSSDRLYRMKRLREAATSKRADNRSGPNITWPRQWSTDSTQDAMAESPFRALPTEVTLQIFRYLSVYDLGQVSLICRRLKMIADHDELWKAKCNSE